MQKKISKLPFKGTAEQEQKLKEVIEASRHDKSLLMSVMQQAQDIYGYLPMEVQEMIAEGMDVPLEKVYGVSTFYAQFSLSPKGEYNISVSVPLATLRARAIFSISSAKNWASARTNVPRTVDFPLPPAVA